MYSRMLICLVTLLASASTWSAETDTQTNHPADPTAEADEWGEWNLPSRPQFGVGLRGRDEQQLNIIDQSTLLDYHRQQPTTSNPQHSPHDIATPATKPSTDTTTPIPTPIPTPTHGNNNAQPTGSHTTRQQQQQQQQQQSEQQLMRSLEEELLEDLVD